ncbi:MAG: 3-keto-5-aminohexanoate cleavage protein [Minwuia sp.]|nr:3-keto-5-aminohexanoate cleavage protein [Minwuia sp.]
MALEPAILTVAPNGARRTTGDHAALPVIPATLAETALACRDAGAAMIHLHVRDSGQRHSLDPGLYRQAIEAIREAVGDDLIVQATSEAAGIYQAPAQLAAMRALAPEAVSVGLREFVPDDTDRDAVADFAAFLAFAEENRMLVQHILYDATDVARFIRLRASGHIPAGRAHALFVLGRYSQGQQSAPADLAPFLAAMQTAPDHANWLWAVCAFGAQEAACAARALELSGHARVGFENNLLLADGSMAPDNASLVAQAAAAASALDRPLANAATARQMMRNG